MNHEDFSAISDYTSRLLFLQNTKLLLERVRRVCLRQETLLFLVLIA